MTLLFESVRFIVGIVKNWFYLHFYLAPLIDETLNFVTEHHHPVPILLTTVIHYSVTLRSKKFHPLFNLLVDDNYCRFYVNPTFFLYKIATIFISCIIIVRYISLRWWQDHQISNVNCVKFKILHLTENILFKYKRSHKINGSSRGIVYLGPPIFFL